MPRANAVNLLNEKLSASKAKDPLKTMWIDRHQQALQRSYGSGMAIRMVLQGLAIYAEQHRKRYDSEIGSDGVLGRAWVESLRGVRDLLNGELDGLDAGTIDSAICALAKNEGVDL